MLNHHTMLPRLRKVTIAVVYTWPGGAISLWPVPSVEETRIACWKSARAAFELAKQSGSNSAGTTTCAITTWPSLKSINTDPSWPTDKPVARPAAARLH